MSPSAVPVVDTESPNWCYHHQSIKIRSKLNKQKDGTHCNWSLAEAFLIGGILYRSLLYFWKYCFNGCCMAWYGCNREQNWQNCNRENVGILKWQFAPKGIRNVTDLHNRTLTCVAMRQGRERMCDNNLLYCTVYNNIHLAREDLNLNI